MTQRATDLVRVGGGDAAPEAEAEEDAAVEALTECVALAGAPTTGLLMVCMVEDVFGGQ